MEECWKPVVGYEGFYEVSNYGRVRRTGRGRGASVGTVLVATAQNSGHQKVNLSRSNEVRTYRVHTLVLEAFVGPRPKNMEARHFPDRDPVNNKLTNLQWGTLAENQADRVVHGTDSRGEKRWNAKLCEVDIERVFDLRRMGCSQQKIASWLTCSRPLISLILSKKRWSHANRKEQHHEICQL